MNFIEKYRFSVGAYCLKYKLPILFSSMILAIVIYWVAGGFNRPQYLSIKISDIPDRELMVSRFHDETYLIVKVPLPLQLKQDPYLTEPYKNIRVFSVSSSNGFLLLPSRTKNTFGVPCLKLEYIYSDFTHDDKAVSGGFKCVYSVSPWWLDNQVYDLQGKNIKSAMNDLYVPQFYIMDGELRIGVSL